MARATKLKVFCAPMGFYDALVAAPSQKAALKAWGTTTDLFGAGRASVVEDPALQELALARPGEVVKRARGDEAAILNEIAEEQAKAPRPAKPKTAKAPPPDRSKLDEAERQLAAARDEHQARLDELARERAELDDRERDERRTGDARIRDLERVVDAERRAFTRSR